MNKPNKLPDAETMLKFNLLAEVEHGISSIHIDTRIDVRMSQFSTKLKMHLKIDQMALLA